MYESKGGGRCMYGGGGGCMRVKAEGGACMVVAVDFEIEVLSVAGREKERKRDSSIDR